MLFTYESLDMILSFSWVRSYPTCFCFSDTTGQIKFMDIRNKGKTPITLAHKLTKGSLYYCMDTWENLIFAGTNEAYQPLKETYRPNLNNDMFKFKVLDLTKTGSCVWEIEKHEGMISHVYCFDPENFFTISDVNNTIKFWDIRANNQKPSYVRELNFNLKAVDYNSERSLLSLASKEDIAFITLSDLRKGLKIAPFDIGWKTETSAICIAPDEKKAMIGAIDSTIMYIEVEKGTLQLMELQNNKSLLASEYSVVSFKPHTTKNLLNQTLLYPVRDLEFIPNNHTIINPSNSTNTSISINSSTINTTTTTITSNKNFASAGNDGTILCYDMDTFNTWTRLDFNNNLYTNKNDKVTRLNRPSEVMEGLKYGIECIKYNEECNALAFFTNDELIKVNKVNENMETKHYLMVKSLEL